VEAFCLTHHPPKRLNQCKGKKYAHGEGHICMACYKRLVLPGKRAPVDPAAVPAAPPAPPPPPAAKRGETGKMATRSVTNPPSHFDIHHWRFNSEAGRFHITIDHDFWIDIARVISETEWEYLHNGALQCNLGKLDKEELPLRSGLEMQRLADRAREEFSTLAHVPPAQIAHAVSVKLIKQPPGTAAQRIHYDIKIREQARIGSWIYYCTPGVSTFMPHRPIAELDKFFIDSDYAPSRAAQERTDAVLVAGPPLFYNFPVVAGDSMMFLTTNHQ